MGRGGEGRGERRGETATGVTACVCGCMCVHAWPHVPVCRPVSGSHSPPRGQVPGCPLGGLFFKNSQKSSRLGPSILGCCGLGGTDNNNGITSALNSHCVPDTVHSANP